MQAKRRRGPGRGGEEKLSKRNDTRRARAKHTRVSSHASSYRRALYVYVYMYVAVYAHIHTYTRVACYGYALACMFMAIDRPSSRTHLSTCHYTSGTSVLCTVTLRENDGLGWRTRIYYTAYSRDANNDRDCNREPYISPDSICCCII